MKKIQRNNRLRIISWLFPKRHRERRREILINNVEVRELPRQEKPEKKRPVDKLEIEETITEIKEEEKAITSIEERELDTPRKDENEKSVTEKPISEENSIEEIQIEEEKKSINIEERELNPPIQEKNDRPTKDIKVPEEYSIEEDVSITFVDDDVSDEIEQVEVIEPKSDEKEREEEQKEEVVGVTDTYPLPIEITTIEEETTTELNSQDEEEILEEEVNDKSNDELLEITIIEEIDTVLKNDYYDLQDLRYRLDLLEEKTEDEVLVENIEQLQQEMDEVIDKFNQIKKKYDSIYGNLSMKDIEAITNNTNGNNIIDYLNMFKNKKATDLSIKQVNDLDNFINVMEAIVNIERKKDALTETIDAKQKDYNIRDDKFLELQDEYTNIDIINEEVEKYNIEIQNIFQDIENKVNNSDHISKRIDVMTKIVPDINKIMKASLLMTSSKAIPPTFAGNLFRTTLLATAIHMLATAITPQREEKEITTITVIDYSKEISYNRDSITNVLNNIENAFTEIDYMKKTFAKDLEQFKNKIPKYDELIQNILSIEKTLLRQQKIANDYNQKLNDVLYKNDQKVKTMENE